MRACGPPTVRFCRLAIQPSFGQLLPRGLIQYRDLLVAGMKITS
jgi:hypothetical protein